MSTALFVLLFIASAMAAQYEGYLVDRGSLDARIVGGNSLVSNPEKYTADVASTAAAESSGFSILAAPSSSPSDSYGTIVNFTSTSNNKAASFIRSLPAGRANLLVRVNGNIAGGALELTDLAIWDIGVETGTTHTFVGFITDRICLDKIVGFDGAHMMNSPETHTAHCLVYSPCKASGMALLLKKGRNPATNAVDTGYGAIYNFTTVSNSEIVSWADGLPFSQNNLFMQFTGTIDSNGIITKTSSFQQATPAPPPVTTQTPTSNPSSTASPDTPSPANTQLPETRVPSATPAPTSNMTNQTSSGVVGVLVSSVFTVLLLLLV